MSAPAEPAEPTDTLSEGLFQVQNQALLRAILDSLSEGVVVADAQGRLLYYSPVARRLLGLTVVTDIDPEKWASHYGTFYPDTVTPLSSDKLPLYRALKGEHVESTDTFQRNPAVPEGVHVRVSANPIYDTQGRLAGAIAVVRDIHDERQAEADRRRTEQRFRLIVETAQEGVWTLDVDGYTTYVNRYMAEMLGYSVEEMMSMPMFAFTNEEGKRAIRESLARRSTSGSDVRDLELFRKDGKTLWALVSTNPILDDQGRYVGTLAMVTNVTRRREAEEQVRKLNEELERRIIERTAQLEFYNRELEAFAYSVAHDLRTPLRSISSFSQALVEDCADRLDDAGLDYLHRIRAATQRMADLIDGLLSLSRVNRAELVVRECDLSALARSIAEQLQRTQPERQARFSLQEGLVAQGDPRLLRLVLENLLSNAWKFTRQRSVTEIEFGALQPAGGVRTYFVRDNGAGFDMAYRDKLFGVFQRLHTQSEFEGNGVGLATVQRIVRRHGGRIWGEGVVGQGATFFFTLHEYTPGTQPPSPQP